MLSFQVVFWHFFDQGGAKQAISECSSDRNSLYLFSFVSTFLFVDSCNHSSRHSFGLDSGSSSEETHTVSYTTPSSASSSVTWNSAHQMMPDGASRNCQYSWRVLARAKVDQSS